MSMEVVNSATLSPRLRLRSSLELSQLRGPEIVEEVADGGQAVRANHKQVAGPIAPLRYKSGGSQDPQVMGDDLLGHPQLQCDLPDRSGLIADAREYPAAGRVGQGM